MRELAIAGAGVTGAYLYHILNDAGREADLFDRQQVTRCGITSCAWGTSHGFIDLVASAGLDAEKYVLRHLDYVLIDDVRVKAELMVFDKPKLIKDLLKDAEVHFEPLPVVRYERVIDATGASRALLPPIEDDIVMMCRQYLVETKEPLENRIKLGGIGYAWCFPLSYDRYHVGCGSLLPDPQEILKREALNVFFLGDPSPGRLGRAACTRQELSGLRIRVCRGAENMQPGSRVLRHLYFALT